MHQVVDRSASSAMIKAYDISGHLNGTPHGPPVATQSFTPTAAITGGTDPPEGVAIVITLQAPYGSDDEFLGGTRPRARDRGRIYFGPITAGGVGKESSTGRSVIPLPITTDLLLTFRKMAVGYTIGAIQYALCVWSRKSALLKPLSVLWCDDRPDYQRRRADQGASRQQVTIP
jgi:hypothetical protein